MESMSMNSNTSSQFLNGSFHQRYNTSLKESINTAETEINSFLSKGIMDNDTNARLRVYHVSHRLKKAGLKHHRTYDTSKYNGFTIAIINAGINTYIWSANCEAEDQYNRTEGRAVALRKVLLNLKSLQTQAYELFEDEKYPPVIVDESDAFQYFYKDNEYHMTSKQETRAVIDWYIKTVINHTKPKQQFVISRQDVVNKEQKITSALADYLKADFQLIYDYSEKDKTKLEVIIANSEFNKQALSENNKADLEKCISDFKVTVERYVGDVDNRVHARFFAINRLMKIIKRKFNKPTYVAQSIC